MRKEFLKINYELDLISSGQYDFIVGLDEVGRGSWAGPVAVGGYLVDKNTTQLEGIQDSKMLSLKKREEKYSELSKDYFKVKFGEVESIDKAGVGKCIEDLIQDIVNEFRYENPDKKILFHIDGQFSKDFGADTKKEPKSDSTYYCVAAASILAKVQRDRLMKQLHSDYPQYFFDSNVGYPSKKHIEALQLFGATKIHRNSFEPIRNLSSQMNLL